MSAIPNSAFNLVQLNLLDKVKAYHNLLKKKKKKKKKKERKKCWFNIMPKVCVKV